MCNLFLTEILPNCAATTIQSKLWRSTQSIMFSSAVQCLILVSYYFGQRASLISCCLMQLIYYIKKANVKEDKKTFFPKAHWTYLFLTQIFKGFARYSCNIYVPVATFASLFFSIDFHILTHTVFRILVTWDNNRRKNPRAVANMCCKVNFAYT